MRIRTRITALLCACLAPLAAGAQAADILAGAPPTRIYVETSYDANRGREDCHWYASGTELVASLAAARSDFDADCVIDIRLKGTLNRDGARHFSDLVAQLGRSPLRPAAIVLDSRGGDADAALAIARTIRASSVFRRVAGGVSTRLDAADTAVCFSACIVVFAAGYERSLDFNIYGNKNLPSRLGIHAPGQFNRTAGRYDTSADNAGILRIRQALMDYFEEVGVSSELVDDMFAVPFDDLHLLDEATIRRYGLLDDQA